MICVNVFIFLLFLLSISLVKTPSEAEQDLKESIIKDINPEYEEPTSGSIDLDGLERIQNNKDNNLIYVIQAEPKAKERIQEAINEWNDKLPDDVLKLVHMNDTLPELIIKYMSSDIGYIAEGYINNDITSITITTTRLQLVKSISLHEIGHALGLEHNYRPYSIMNPIVHEHSRISPHDVEEILHQQRHGPGN